jgi:ATP-dependent helicase/nuclease subunit B
MMKKTFLSVYTIAPGKGFLHTLAQAILNGFPLGKDEKKPPLSAWTILVPTRRAARELTTILTKISGKNAIVLPRIKPIGDLDEDRLDDIMGDLPQAISPIAQIFILLDLLSDWAKENPNVKLAQEIATSPTQSFSLALSLQQLVNQIETEETNFERLSDVYQEDLSEHRNAILSLLGLLKTSLPQRLHMEQKFGPAERRSRVIKLESQNISEGRGRGPIVAAGSTGTIPATRALLKSIAEYHQGAVILPGLDQSLDDYSWKKIEPEHPQYSLKVLIESLGIERTEIAILGPGSSERHWLTSELMRPSATAEKWQETLFNTQTEIANAVRGVTCLEAPNRHLEARSIALILRHALEKPDQSAALITPDRDLAKRVKSELQRWNIVIDDSAGEPLAQFGVADLAMRLFNTVKDNFSAAGLLNLLTHADCDLGLVQDQYSKLLQQFEIAVLRGYGSGGGLQGIESAFNRAFQAHQKKIRNHPLVQILGDEDWQNLQRFTLQIMALLRPLAQRNMGPLADQLQCLRSTITALAPNLDHTRAENQAYAAAIYEIECEAGRHPLCTFETAGIVVAHVLHSTPHRSANANQHRLAIYGVLEARLLPIDIVILGGLNEGKWPAQPDTGPWLNRNMRKIFGLQQPEREIGVSAHDFAQGLGYENIYLTWSKRIDGVPQIPSRWVLRLQTVLEAGGVKLRTEKNESWLKLAAAIDAPTSIEPHGKPKPTPPVHSRPTYFSASSVEKLIRDPYAIYASKILRLEPLPDLDLQADPALRGTLFHESIYQWNRQNQTLGVEQSLDVLVNEGQKLFAPFSDDAEITSFWWPRFVRMAKWLVAQEHEFRKNLKENHSEITGTLTFEISGVAHHLTARADRIDILRGGGARIIDYKTGTPPSVKQVQSGMSPQLPLEAAVLELSGYNETGALLCLEMVYLQINGAGEGGKKVGIDPQKNDSLSDLGKRHLANFKKLLGDYLKPDQPYYPRDKMKLENEKSDYDHLSRYAEWLLAGQNE